MGTVIDWLSAPLWVIDTETDGVDPATAELVTVCLGQSLRPGHWEPRTWLLKPARPIPAEATAVHGITTEHAEEHGIDRAQALAEIRGALSGTGEAPIVLHNAPYDLTILSRSLGDPGMQWGPVIDTLVLFRRFDLTTGSKSLESLAYRHGFTFPAHDAEADSLATLRLLHILCGENDLLRHVDPVDLHRLQADWYAAQQQAAHFRRRGNGQASEAPDTSWPTH